MNMCLFLFFSVLSVYMFVKDVALLGNEARLTNQELKHLLVSSIVSACR